MRALELVGFCGGYQSVEILHSVSLQVEQGEIVAIIGPNGAGKTTLLRCVMGLTQRQRGSIKVLGREFSDEPVYVRADLGITLVPEGARVFADLTILENLKVGGYLRKRDQRWQESLDMVLTLFPVLGQRLGVKAGTLSGGQRQMLAIGRGLMSGASVLLVDEPSLGLAPILVDEVFEKLGHLREIGSTILLVEQNAPKAFELADRVFAMSAGCILEECRAEDMLDRGVGADLYLGEHGGAT